nr:uncharacterized protein LOC117996018 [Maniola hyperantus]XP_034839920.1 uncharacterized protein LOC117996019 [Maniola hyperantus]
MAQDPDKVYKAMRVIPEFDGNPNVLTRFIKICDQLAAQYLSTAPGSEFTNVFLLNGILNKITGTAACTINSNGIPDSWLGIRTALINNFSDQRDETALYHDLSLLKTEEFTIINSKDEIKGQPLKLMRIPEFKNTQTSVSHLNLSSISLEKLHNLQDKIILQAPVQLDGARPDPLYHTTIPFYTIMAVVSILSIIVILRRYAVKRKPKEVQQHSSRLKMETPDDVPATFSLQVLQ